MQGFKTKIGVFLFQNAHKNQKAFQKKKHLPNLHLRTEIFCTSTDTVAPDWSLLPNCRLLGLSLAPGGFLFNFGEKSENTPFPYAAHGTKDRFTYIYPIRFMVNVGKYTLVGGFNPFEKY